MSGSMNDPRDHDLVPPTTQPHSAEGPAGEAAPEDADGMLDEGGSRESGGERGQRDEQLSRP